jgi:internalin A
VPGKCESQENTAAASLDLSHLDCLYQLPKDLERLRSLQTLDLSWSRHLSGDLSPLAGLTSLQMLDLSGCLGLHRFAALESLLPALKQLYLFGCKFDDLPLEVCGGSDDENVLVKVGAHYQDLKFGQRLDAEVKVLFMGNGGTGKSQLCRRLRGLDYDPTVPTTHGVQLSEMILEDFSEPVRLNLWDFGSQDIYRGSHPLFLEGQAIFLLLWTPKLEEEGDLTFRHRPLTYWLDYLRAFAAEKNPVLLIQSQCDTPRDRVTVPPAATDALPSLRQTAVSVRTGLG